QIRIVELGFEPVCLREMPRAFECHVMLPLPVARSAAASPLPAEPRPRSATRRTCVARDVAEEGPRLRATLARALTLPPFLTPAFELRLVCPWLEGPPRVPRSLPVRWSITLLIQTTNARRRLACSGCVSHSSNDRTTMRSSASVLLFSRL